MLKLFYSPHSCSLASHIALEQSGADYETVGDCFELIETEMFNGPWVMGENYSCADIYLFTIAQWLEADEVDISRFPKVEEHRLKMREVPAIQKVLAQQ